MGFAYLPYFCKPGIWIVIYGKGRARAWNWRSPHTPNTGTVYQEVDVAQQGDVGLGREGILFETVSLELVPEISIEFVRRLV